MSACLRGGDRARSSDTRQRHGGGRRSRSWQVETAAYQQHSCDKRKKRGLRHTGVNVHLLLVAEPDGRVQVQAFAQVVHSRSAFARGPLVSFECRSVPRGNLRALLFGTSAEDGRSVSGAIAQAFGGTLVLRDLDALSEVDQRILLNTLELHADEFRLIGTLSRDPRRAMGPASLCEALFDRLAEGILVG
jgi:transcriptional regulator of acetoin/glycerol metabolism